MADGYMDIAIPTEAEIERFKKKPRILKGKKGAWLCHDHELVAWDTTPGDAYARWKAYRNRTDAERVHLAQCVVVEGNSTLH